MELIIIITSLCITLSVLLKPAHSLQLIQVQSSHDQLAHDHQLTVPALPRKLKLTEEASMKGYEGQDMVSYNTKENHALSAGKVHHHKEAKMIHSNGGTWREWIEGSDTSQFFTMDYSHMRRRRPIHNKSLPVAP